MLVLTLLVDNELACAYYMECLPYDRSAYLGVRSNFRRGGAQKAPHTKKKVGKSPHIEKKGPQQEKKETKFNEKIGFSRRWGCLCLPPPPSTDAHVCIFEWIWNCILKTVLRIRREFLSTSISIITSIRSKSDKISTFNKCTRSLYKRDVHVM